MTPHELLELPYNVEHLALEYKRIVEALIPVIGCRVSVYPQLMETARPLLDVNVTPVGPLLVE